MRVHCWLREPHNRRTKRPKVVDMLCAVTWGWDRLTSPLSPPFLSFDKKTSRARLPLKTTYLFPHSEAHQKFVREGELELEKEMSLICVQEKARNAHTFGTATLTNKVERMHRRVREQQVR